MRRYSGSVAIDSTAAAAALVAAFLLLLLMGGCGAAYEYNLPVSVKASVNPTVLMPGDEAVMAIELQLNSATATGSSSASAASGPGMMGMSSSSTTKTQSSTPVNRTVLKGSKAIKVITPDYRNVGLIGPGDRIVLYYRIKAEENISTGTYLLDFSVLGPGQAIADIRRQIPVKVDSAAVSIARADSSNAASINLNVANPRENTLNAVTIIPAVLSDSKSPSTIEFYPDRYYIGTMDPDEVFTISFSLVSALGDAVKAKPVNMSFAAQYKNGEEWHVSEPFNTTYQPPVEQAQQSSYLLPAGAVLIVLLAAGAWMYRKKKKGRAAGIAAGNK